MHFVTSNFTPDLLGVHELDCQSHRRNITNLSVITRKLTKDVPTVFMKYRLKNVQYTNTNVLVELSNKHTFHLDIDPYLVVSGTPESLKIDVSKSLKYNVFPSVDAANIVNLFQQIH